MKKTILLLLFASLFSVVSFAQKSNTKTTSKPVSIKLIDQAPNPSKHCTLYVFETVNATDILNTDELAAKFKNVKGFVRLQNSPATATHNQRVLFYFDETVSLVKDAKLIQVFADNGLTVILPKK